MTNRLIGRPIDHIVVAVRNLDAAAEIYARLGFTVTPLARHPDHMGTSNRLVQFDNHSFIELVTVDRPETAVDHDFAAQPPEFSFGAHIRDYVAKREGMAALVFASDDARADANRLCALGCKSYAPLDFGREARAPDGSVSRVAFTLAFTTDPAMPDCAFYFCQNHYPQNFWKQPFQRHANGASGLASVFLVATRPSQHVPFLERLTGSPMQPVEGGVRLHCGADQNLWVLTPERIADIAPNFNMRDIDHGPTLAGIAVHCAKPPSTGTAAADACGVSVIWDADSHSHA